MVKKYCTNCHISVSPDLLDKETWQRNVLPAMGTLLGISTWSGQYFPKDIHAGISIVEWQKIVDYFLENAPARLVASKSEEPVLSDADFSIETPSDYDTSNVALTTMVKFDTANNLIYSSEALSKSLFVWDRNLKVKTKQTFDSPVVDIDVLKGENVTQIENLITTIGILTPSDIPRGKLLMTKNGNLQNLTVIAKELTRPVSSLMADFNKDGLDDIVVCGFGNMVGELYLLKQTKDGKYKKTILTSQPGATKAEIGDFNKDGWPDIMCLFAQGEEGIWMYLNDRKGGFKVKNILRFPPVYGSSSFQLVDFNRDGFKDILYTAGDNSDYSRILKPYHGIYIFKNNGENKFEQSFFYPVNGSTKAIAADFNNDGRMDLAAIAFFPDSENNPRESFMYLMQDEPNKFTAYTAAIEKMGKWICMDVDDIDHDGFPDIVLGNFSLAGFDQSAAKSSWNTKLPFIILKNRFKKRLN